MTLSEIITKAINEAGGDGLCNVGLDCGCGLGDLYPCGSPDPGECAIAVKQYDDGEAFNWFVPLRREGEE